ncbi:MAG: transposase [Prevotellaceae bacterium]|nr:transposase [Prevotellaceae bacterium]
MKIDETFVDRKDKNRHKDKKVKNSHDRSYKDKIPVMGIIERKGLLIAKIANDTTGSTLY